MKKFLIAVLLLAASNAQALLPPLFETLKEYRALLNSDEIEKILPSGQAIQKIDRTNEGFEIVTPKFTLEVKVVYEKSGIGPAHFHLEFQDLKPY